MTTQEAAQKWAEAKEALTGKRAAFAAAKAELEAAAETERSAWTELEGLAGRSAVSTVEFVDDLTGISKPPPRRAYNFNDGFGQ